MSQISTSNLFVSQLPQISTGTGIFLASLVIALVLLYGQTKDRWKWGVVVAIPKRVAQLLRKGASWARSSVGAWRLKQWLLYVGVPVAVALTVLVVHQASQSLSKRKAADRTVPASKPTIEPVDASTLQLRGVHLGMPESEIRIQLGGPWSVSDWEGNHLRSTDAAYSDDSPRLLDFRDYESKLIGGTDISNMTRILVFQLHVYTRDKKVVAMEFSPDSLRHYWKRLGKDTSGQPHSIATLLTKFGDPSKTTDSRSGLVRTYFFDDYGIFCKVQKGGIDQAGIYDPRNFPDR